MIKHAGTMPSASLRERVVAHLRSTALTRGALYLGTAVSLFYAIGRLHDRTHPQVLERFHLSLLPCTLAVTRAFAELRAEDRRAWTQLELRGGIRAFVIGAGLGGGALLTTLGIAAARGWVSAPAWGWKQTSAGELGAAVALALVGHAAVAWNEELVYRGYLFDTLSIVVSPAGSAAFVTALFALAHPIQPQTLVGEAALGSALLMLRIQSGGLWVPVGYHWAWNVLQTAVLGPADGPPSLRPLEIHGPHRWLGRPGYPEPGLLMALVNVVVALGVAWWMRRARH